jgi:hypothetical protein
MFPPAVGKLTVTDDGAFAANTYTAPPVTNDPPTVATVTFAETTIVTATPTPATDLSGATPLAGTAEADVAATGVESPSANTTTEPAVTVSDGNTAATLATVDTERANEPATPTTDELAPTPENASAIGSTGSAEYVEPESVPNNVSTVT